MDLINPTPEMVCFLTIARVLARVPRFGGHTNNGVLSVAQHCLEGANAILRDTGRRDAAGAFLLHDAHEAYIGDITTPVVDAIADLSECPHHVHMAIRQLKARLDEAIYTAAGIAWPLPADVRDMVEEYDIRMCRTECDARMAPSPRPWSEPYVSAEPVADVDLWPWTEGTIESLWMGAARDLLPCDFARHRFSVDNLPASG